MNRSEFLKLLAGILGGLALPGTVGSLASAAGVKPRMSQPLDDSYLVKGLTGMARADGWFDAHWGAGLLAGYYLCRDNPLSEPTTTAIKKQLDVVIELRREQFAALPEEKPDERLIEEVPGALRPVMEGGLRDHGHGVIFASLSTRALRDVPEMAQPTLVRGLCQLSREIARSSPTKPPAGAVDYPDTQTMIEATFDSLVRFEGLLGRPSIHRPNFTHMTTHTEALMNLEMMGYGELARAGFPGHRAHISVPVPRVDSLAEALQDAATLEGVMSAPYWDDPEKQDYWRRKWNRTGNPNGHWIAAGHLFKVLYSYHRLIGRIEDKTKVGVCSKVLLERYVNPEVRGG